MERFKSRKIFQDVNPDIVVRFEKFHHENPHVYSLFKKYANELYQAGITRHGAKSIMERLRWDFTFETVGEAFKISNSYTAMYARLLIMKEPRFKGFFKLKRGPGRCHEN